MVEYITELIGFAVVAFVIGRWMLPVINRGMTQKQAVIREQLEEAEEAKRRLSVAREEYEASLEEARQEADGCRRAPRTGRRDHGRDARAGPGRGPAHRRAGTPQIEADRQQA